MKVSKKTGVRLYLHSENSFDHRILLFSHKLKLGLQRKKNEKLRLYGLKVQQLVENGWFRESAVTAAV